MIILLAVITTIIIGWIGTAFGYEYMNFPQLGTLLAVATMGGFIIFSLHYCTKIGLSEIKKSFIICFYTI